MADGMRLRTGALLAVGYGLARAVTSNSYITAFGAEAGTSRGFVAQTSFSVATNLVSAAVALALVLLVLRGFARGAGEGEGRAAGDSAGSGADAVAASGARRRLMAFAGGRMPAVAFACSAAVMLAGYAAGASGLLGALGVGTGALACAVVYAVGSVVMALAWFEPFALEPDVRLAVRGLVCGFLVQAGGFFTLSYLGGWALFAAVLAVLVVSGAAYALLARDRRAGAGVDAGGVGAAGAGACGAGVPGGSGAPAGVAAPASTIAIPPAPAGGLRGALGLLRQELRGLFGPLLCVFVLTAVVGLLHTSVIGGAFEPVVGSVPMAEALVLAAALLALVVLLARRVPETASVYRVLFPVMLVALSALPFIPNAFGHYAGMVMVVCYDLVGMAFVLFLVETARGAAVPQVALMGVYQAGTQLFLVVGLLLGIALNGLEARAAASYATILILVCIYLLAMVPALLLRRRDRLGSGPVAVPVSPAAAGMRAGVEARAAGRSGAAVPPGGASRGAYGDALAWDACVAAGTAGADGGAGAAGASPTTGAALSTQSAEGDFERQQEVRGRVGARVEEFALERGLTAREAQVLVQLARGWSANAIAADLGIAQNTAWAHIKRIYVKLDVHSKQELIEYVEREVINRPDAE